MKTLRTLLLRIFFAALFASCGSAMAAGVDLVGDDTDLFTTNPNIPAQVPNVLIIVDNTANWDRNNNGWGGNLDPACTSWPSDKQGGAETCAIYVQTSKLAPGVNVGFMMFNAQNKGSYVKFPMQSMTPGAGGGIAKFQTLLKALDPGASANKVGSNSTYEDKMNDVFRYFNSLSTYAGAADAQADAAAYTDSGKTNFQFLSGQNGDTCGYDYIIFIGNGFPNSQSWTANPPAGGAAEVVAAATLLNDSANVNFGTNNADLVPIQNSGSNTDVWSKFMFKYGVKVANGSYRHITTYTINVCSFNAAGTDTCPTDFPDQTKLLKSMASVSNGKYFAATNLSGIALALSTIFAEVQAVNSVFAATTLPVSINVRGTNLNQVYIGVFRPDSLASPRWLGNLKQYQLGVNSTTGALQLVDANLTQAVNLNTGFISNSATSFWTTAYDADAVTAGTQGFWSFRTPFATTDVGKDQDSPDGDLVEKGGAAERIRITYPSPDLTAAQTRNIYTCTGSCAAGSLLSDTPFTLTNTDITGTVLGTYQSFSVSSLSASGTTATATTAAPHGFANGASITIAGAVPNLFNGTYTIATTGLTTFTYTLPSAPDTNHAYVTQPGYALVPGTDLLRVTGASPAAYNTTPGTDAAIASVVGNANQYSYSLASSPTSAASGYTVTGVRQVQPLAGPSRISWSNATALNNVTVNLTNHGYATGDIVAISGASDAAFNTAGSSITVPTGSTSQFTYSTASTPAGGATTTGIATPSGGIPSGWTSGTVVSVSGASGNFNTPAGGSAITVSGNTFSYTTNGSVSGSATGALAASRIVASDTSTWTLTGGALVTTTVNQGSSWNVTAITSAACASTTCLRFTLTQGKLTTGTAIRKLTTTPGDSIQINGTTCSFRDSGNTTTSCLNTNMTVVNVVYSCNSSAADTTALVGGASTTFQNFATPGGCANGNIFVDVTAPGNNGVKSSPSPSVSGAAMNYTGSNAIASAIRFTLATGQYTGQFLRQLAAGDLISLSSSCTYTVAGSANFCTPTPSNTPPGTLAVVAVSGNSAGTASVVGPNTPASISGTVTVDIAPSNLSGATAVSVPANTTLTWTGATTSASVTLTSIAAGPLTVNASGLIYSAKAGDLTSKVTSITNQSVATGTITAGLATVPDPNERANLINWVRGMDNKENENGNASLTDVRTSIHGDVLHSRPAVINYNRSGNDNDVYVYYGANDGMLHAIKGGQATDGGNEQWTFIAPEHFGKLKRLRDQTPSISSNYPKGYFFDGPIGVYTLDANSDTKLTTGASGDKVYLFTAMRRGGRMLYAFDITDPTAPKLLWKKGCTEPTGSGTTAGTGGCNTGWGNIGQTWSQPQVVYLRAYPTTPVLIFGAGYDPAAEDFQPCYVTDFSGTSVTGKTGLTPPTPMSVANCPPTGGSSTTGTRAMGQGVFVVNALTGAMLWSAGPAAASPTLTVSGMNYSITADVAILRNRANTAARSPSTGIENVPAGYMDRIYAPDTGGNVWRFDVADADPAKWVVTKLAGLSAVSASSTSTGSPAAANMRKFEFQPDVVYTATTGGTKFDAVLLGSGDREHPFDQVTSNRFYMLKDFTVGSLALADVTSPNSPPATIAETNLSDITNGCLQSAANCPAGTTQADAQTDLDSKKGWLLQLANVGEKTVSSATTAASTVIFNTNQPKQDTVTGSGPNVGANASNQCVSDLGTARQYGINFQNGNAQNIFNSLPTQYVPSAGQGRFATFAGGGFLPTPVPVVVQIGGKYYQTVIAGVQTTNPGGLKLQSRLRTYWYRKTD